MTIQPFGFRRFIRTFSVAACVSVASVAALSGCAVYRHEIVQGNFISQEQVQALQVGMPSAYVRQILGTPLITDLFRGQRWDYVFTMQHRRGVEPKKYIVSVFFEGDALQRVEGAENLPTEQDFVNSIAGKKKYKPRTLAATPEQLQKHTATAPEAAQPTEQPALPQQPATQQFPELPQ